MYTEPLHLMSLLIQYFSARVEHAVTCYVLQGVLSLFRSLALLLTARLTVVNLSPIHFFNMVVITVKSLGILAPVTVHSWRASKTPD